MKNRLLVENVNWKHASTNHDDDFHTDIVFLRASTGPIKNICGHCYNNAALHYEKFTGKFYYPDNEANYICTQLANKFIDSPNWGQTLNDEVYTRSDNLTSIWSCIHPDNLTSLTTFELARYYRDQLAAQEYMYEPAWIIEILQDDDYGIYRYFRRYLASKGVNSQDCDRFIKILSSGHGESIYKKELSILVQLAAAIRQDAALFQLFVEPSRYLRAILPAWIKSEIFKLANNFGFLGYHGYDSRRPYGFDEYVLRLGELVGNDKAYDDARLSLKPYEIDRSSRASLACTLGIDLQYQKIFQHYGEFAVSKAYRRLSQLKNFYYLDRLLEEIAMRLDMPEKWLRFMKPEEIIGLLTNSLASVEDVDERSKMMLYMIAEGREVIWTGSPARELAQKLSNSESDNIATTHLYGLSACGGYAKGKAIIRKRKSELLHFDYDGPCVLVSVEADPDLSLIMRKMAAVVTDQGGVTCHAAIIAREFNIPCVVGTKNATRFISEGDEIEVNANEGVVRIIR